MMKQQNSMTIASRFDELHGLLIARADANSLAFHQVLGLMDAAAMLAEINFELMHRVWTLLQIARAVIDEDWVQCAYEMAESIMADCPIGFVPVEGARNG